MAGHIESRGENTWLVRVYLGRDSRAGKRRYHNHTVRGTKKDAQKYLNAVLREKDLGTFVEPVKITLDQHLDQWLETAAKCRLSEGTFASYEYMLKRYVRPLLGYRKLATLSPLDLQMLYNALQSRGLSARTVRYVHSVLSSALKQAIKWRMLTHNPASAVDVPRHERREMRAFSPEEAGRFLAAASGDRYCVLFAFALTTGMRPEEYLSLQWKDLDLKTGITSVQRTLIWRRKGGGWCFGEPKTPRSRRTIPLPASVVRALATHRRLQAEERLKAGSNYTQHDLVFATSEGGPLMLRNLIRRHFKPILKRAGLPDSIRLYDLRHSCATLLLAAEENPKVVSERLGHASIVLTLDTYSHVLPSMQKAASDKLETMLFSPAGAL